MESGLYGNPRPNRPSLLLPISDPFLGAVFSNVASYLALIAMLFARPYGLIGRPDVVRV